MSIYLPPFVQVNVWDNDEQYVATAHIVSIADTDKDPPAWRITTADHRTFLVSPHVAERLLQGAVKDPWGNQPDLPQDVADVSVGPLPPGRGSPFEEPNSPPM